MVREKILWIKDEFLQQILNGEKTIEIRVGYRNIKRLQAGDILLLNEQYRYEIVDIRSYPNFEAMVAAENPTAIAPRLADTGVLLAACRAIYPPEKEALGVIALEIQPLRQPDQLTKI